MVVFLPHCFQVSPLKCFLVGIYPDFSGEQEACTLNIFDATIFCIGPLSNNFYRGAGGLKVRMPAWTGREQGKWARMRCAARVMVDGGGWQGKSWSPK